MEDILAFVSRNRDSIWSGVISSVLVLALQVVVSSFALTLSYMLTRRFLVRRLFRFGSRSGDKRVYVVSGTLGHESKPHLAVLMGPDASAAANVISALEDAYPETEVKHLFCNHIGEALFDENLVAVGGPLFNTCTAEILRRLSRRVWFDETEVIHVGDKTFKQEIDGSANRVVTDFGVLLRMQSPWHPNKTVSVVAGIGSAGVLAASYIGGRKRKYPNLRLDIARKVGWRNALLNRDFVAIVKCEGFANDVSGLEIVLASTIDDIHLQS